MLTIGTLAATLATSDFTAAATSYSAPRVKYSFTFTGDGDSHQAPVSGCFEQDNGCRSCLQVHRLASLRMPLSRPAPHHTPLLSASLPFSHIVVVELPSGQELRLQPHCRDWLHWKEAHVLVLPSWAHSVHLRKLQDRDQRHDVRPLHQRKLRLVHRQRHLRVLRESGLHQRYTYRELKKRQRT